MKLYYRSDISKAYGVCPKCKSSIEFDVNQDAVGTYHDICCLGCGQIYRDTLLEKSPREAVQTLEMVNHPAHYQSETGMEVIDVMEAFTFDLKGAEAIATSNVIKYICRWKNKNGVQDLNKAMWYLTHLINYVENKEKEND